MSKMDSIATEKTIYHEINLTDIAVGSTST